MRSVVWQLHSYKKRLSALRRGRVKRTGVAINSLPGLWWQQNEIYGKSATVSRNSIQLLSIWKLVTRTQEKRGVMTKFMMTIED